MTEYYRDEQVTLLLGDALEQLRTLPDASVDCTVSSPPYFWMRDYGTGAAQYGLEPTPQDYLNTMREVMAEVHRVLAADGTLWLNLGDAYSQRKAVRLSSHQEGLHGAERGARPSWRESRAAGRARMSAENLIGGRPVTEKSLMMLPERLLIAMQDDGWILRSKIVWSKAYCTPDAAPDRPSGRWEPIYLLSKSSRYHWNAGAPGADRDVWEIPASRGGTVHTASYPLELPARAIAAGCPEGGLVLDPFSGSGTTGVAALASGRRYVGIDLSAEYHNVALGRLAQRELAA
ncbi:site-specific DNA-methyltransferase [Streptomyces sp. NBC_01324]|uniref:DNA-methyltransferase n=1 Tax=Streptomyces sp. NBC_01324 TaxID=2903826 RepID=UPI002E103291|nr:site-specific DNA-methyltransferase [Streptomyces sp. NBC_01324]